VLYPKPTGPSPRFPACQGRAYWVPFGVALASTIADSSVHLNGARFVLAVRSIPYVQATFGRPALIRPRGDSSALPHPRQQISQRGRRTRATGPGGELRITSDGGRPRGACHLALGGGLHLYLSSRAALCASERIVGRWVFVTTQTDTTTEIDPRALPADGFTASDRVRIELGGAIARAAAALEKTALMLSGDQAVAGDYVARVRTDELFYRLVIEQAVIAERIRGTSWESVGRPFHISADEAERRWGAKVETWKARTKAQSVHVRDPGAGAAHVDEYVMTGCATRLIDDRRPLSNVLDAAAPLTGRDVAAADRSFAGSPVCEHCHH